MAQIDRRVSSKGVVSWRVRWRHHMERTWQSITVDNATEAKALKAAVETRNHLILATDPALIDDGYGRPILTGRAVRRVSGGLTFLEVAEDYFTHRPTRKHSTIVANRSTLNRQLACWHDLPVADITRDDAIALVNEILSNGQDPRRAVKLAHAVIGRALAEGYRSDGVNPLSRLSLPKRPTKAVALTPDEVAVVLDLAESVGDRLMVQAALETGMRLAELCALKPTDIELRPDRNRAIIHVQRAATLGTRKRWVAGPPKTGNAYRDLPISLTLAKALLRASHDGWVWTAPRAGGMANPTSVGGRWSKLIVAKGMASGALYRHLRFHDLRHTHATELLACGIDLKTVSMRLGHQSIAITADIYSHVTPQADDRVMSALQTASWHRASESQPLRLVKGSER